MNKKESVRVSKAALAEVIFSLVGQDNVLTVHRPYVVMLGGDAAAALFLEQLIYWSDKGHRGDGFIYKSRKEWADELGLSPGVQRRVRNKLEQIGLIETKLHRADGAPTLHYRVDGNKLIEALVYSVQQGRPFCPEEQKDLLKRTNGFAEEDKSLTETTTETTKTLTPQNGVVAKETIDFKEPKPRKKHTPESIREGAAKAIAKFEKKHRGDNGIDPTWRNTPAHQGQILTEFTRLSSIPAPKTKRLRNNATYAAETLYQECGSADECVRRMQRFFAERSGGQEHQFTIVDLNSIVKTICAMGAKDQSLHLESFSFD